MGEWKSYEKEVKKGNGIVTYRFFSSFSYGMQ